MSCPYQMRMTEHGCAELYSDIKVRNFVVLIGLSLTSSLRPNFNKLTQLQKEQPFTWMETPCSKISWTDIGMFSTKKTDVLHNRFKNYLLVRLSYVGIRELSLKNVRGIIAFCLKQPWSMTLENHVFKYNVEIYPYIRVMAFKSPRLLTIYEGFDIKLNTIFHKQKDDIATYPFEMSKLFFCNMVSKCLKM